MPIYILVSLGLAIVAAMLGSFGIWRGVSSFATPFLFGITMILILGNIIGHSDDRQK